MKRVTREQLERAVSEINRLVGGDYSIEWAYGRPRLSRNGESVDVSPRLPPRQLLDWMNAFIAGIAVGYTWSTEVQNHAANQV